MQHPRSVRSAAVVALVATASLAVACVPPPSGPSPTTTTASTTASTTTTTEDPVRCDIERRTIRTALDAWQASYGSWPTDLDQLQGPDGFLEPGSLQLAWDYQVIGDGYVLEGPC